MKWFHIYNLLQPDKVIPHDVLYGEGCTAMLQNARELIILER